MGIAHSHLWGSGGMLPWESFNFHIVQFEGMRCNSPLSEEFTVEQKLMY